MAPPCHMAGNNARLLLICSHPAIGEFKKAPQVIRYAFTQGVSVGEIPHSYIVAHSDLSSDAHQSAFTEDAVQSRFRYTGAAKMSGMGVSRAR